MKVKDLKGIFSATAIRSRPTLEDRQDVIDDITRQVKEQGGTVTVKDNTVYADGSNQYWRLPTLDRVRQGVVTFRSKDFTFAYIDSLREKHLSYCDKPKAKYMTEKGFTTVDFSGRITTWILQ